MVQAQYFSFLCNCLRLHFTSKTDINQKYQKIYNFLGAGMIISPVSSALLLHFSKEINSIIYFIELAAAWGFSAYWLVKTSEINES
jgi:hypothetical protein